MWVPNSERGHKMPSLEGENEIPHIPKLDFLTILAPLHDYETKPTLQNKSCSNKTILEALLFQLQKFE